MNIAPASHKNINDLLKIGSTEPYFKVADGATAFWSEDELRAIIASPNDIVLVCTKGGEIIGFLIALVNLPARKMTIENVWVAESHRSKGIAAQLIERCMDSACSSNIKHVAGMVEVDNEASVKLFQTTGFEKGQTYLWMHREL